jgi:hypothetical protein
MPQNGPSSATENGGQGVEPAMQGRSIANGGVPQVKTENEYTSPHGVECDSPSNVSRANTTAGHTDEASESDEDDQSEHSRGHGDHEPGGGESDESEGENEDEHGEAEEPALKYERMGGAAQEFFETGKDSASALCVGRDSFVSGAVYETVVASLLFCSTVPSVLSPIQALAQGYFGLYTVRTLAVYTPDMFSFHYLTRDSFSPFVPI